MFSYLSNSLEYIIPFLIVLTVLVFIHELGHYLVARWNGVKVEVFSIGFGPEIFGWTDKSQTRWKFSLIPLGGYVRMYGDVDPSGQAVNPELQKMNDDQKKLTLASKTPLQRIAVSAAGPIANYLLAAVIFCGIFMTKGEPIITNDIGGIQQGSVAEHMGIKPGDQIIKINEIDITKFYDIVDAITPLPGKDIQVTVSRPDTLPTDLEKEIPADTPRSNVVLSGKMIHVAEDKTETPAVKLGIVPLRKTFRSVGVIESFSLAIQSCYKYSVDILTSIGQMITQQKGSGDLGGILSIGNVAKESAAGGAASLLLFMAMLSVNLGLINLLPVPVLDGGHILFCTIEAIIGRPVSEKVQEWAFGIGLTIVLGLMLLTTWNDVSHFKLIDKLLGLFR